MNMETKDHLLGVFLAVLDGRDPRPHLTRLDGEQCVEGHKIFRACDDLLHAQWRLSIAAPDPAPEPTPEPSDPEQVVLIPTSIE